MTKKPTWMYFAAEAQKQLDKVKPTKSGKGEERCLYDSWRTASDKYGYTGSRFDWEVLMQRIRAGKIKIEACTGQIQETERHDMSGLDALNPRLKF